MAIVAEREIPARQWTMTRQLETLALSAKEDREKRQASTRRNTSPAPLPPSSQPPARTESAGLPGDDPPQGDGQVSLSGAVTCEQQGRQGRQKALTLPKAS